MKAADWTDYAFFAAVAGQGGLAAAARALDVSVATLSRRMRALETRLGRRLFVHGAAGYTLTAEGRALRERLRGMEAAAVEVDRWRAAATGPVPVRISAGTWTGLDLAEHLHQVWQPSAIWLPEFVYGERRFDLARREIDIGLRNARPDQPWLAGRRVGKTEFAVYARDADVSGWIGASVEAPNVPSARWVETHHGQAIVTRANAPLLALHMARAGVGRVVLPVTVGDATEGLERLSDPIPDLTSDQWLVSHQDSREDPPIRAALDALAGFFERRRMV